MKLSDLQNLDMQNVGSWPVPVKIAAVLLLGAAIIGAGWYLDWRHQHETLVKAEAKERELKQAFETKQRKAANLEPLKRQMEDMQQSFGDMLRRLPNRTEVAALLVDISQQGLAAGLEFELFRPGREQPADFYAEQPIQIRVTGTYHEFGRFVSGVADLPRIVTQHNVKITPQGRDPKLLVMETTAKTYRYLDEDEEAEIQRQAQAAARQQQRRR